MLMFDPIGLLFCKPSSFADTLILPSFEICSYVLEKWPFTFTKISLVLVALAVSYVFGYLTFLPAVSRYNS